MTLGEGSTPLVELARYGRAPGEGRLWAKWEPANPTGSFKDRVAAWAVSWASAEKYAGGFIASSGNAAASMAAYGARGGLPILVLLRDDAAPEKVRQILSYGPRALAVRDLYDDPASLERGLGRVAEALPGWRNLFVWAPFNPLFVEALKTIAYEIAEDLGAPDYVIVPVAGGDLLTGVFRGFQELRRAGRIDRLPRLVAAQSQRSSPTVAAVEGRAYARSEGPPTVAGALRVEFPSPHAADAVVKSGGFGVAVPEAEIVAAQGDLGAQEGLYVEASSAVAFAAARIAWREGRFARRARVVVVATGAGAKDDPRPVFRPPVATVDELTPGRLRSLWEGSGSSTAP